MILSKLDHLGSSHIDTARTTSNLRGVFRKRSVVGGLGSGDTGLLLNPRVLARQEVLGLLLALGEVREVPVSYPGRQGGIHPLLVFP